VGLDVGSKSVRAAGAEFSYKFATGQDPTHPLNLRLKEAFDRIRENIKLLRREKLADIVNRSINQTLSRTILTAGLTFLTVLALFLFGGEVLRGFSFALVVGILIGTYSSIAIAAPILVAYQEWRTGRGERSIAMAPTRSGAAQQPRAKVKA